MTDTEIESAEDTYDEDRLSIRQKISSLSFEDLLKIKEKMGSKLYNETVFGIRKNERKKEFKRANKNRPREVSSKLKQKQLKHEFNNGSTPTIKKTIPRDPRFDPLCGQFDDKTFKSNYKFINDIRQKERKQLKEELKTCTDAEKKNTIKLLIQRMDNKIREQLNRETEEKKKFEEKMDIREKLKKGEKPVFKKKSVKKLENLIEKFENLKKTNKLQKHMKRKSKKISLKDNKKLINPDVL